MLAMRTPRPALYGWAIISQALADRDVDLADTGECRLAMLEAFGVEPDVDWAFVCSMAMVMRRLSGGGFA